MMGSEMGKLIAKRDHLGRAEEAIHDDHVLRLRSDRSAPPPRHLGTHIGTPPEHLSTPPGHIGNPSQASLHME